MDDTGVKRLAAACWTLRWREAVGLNRYGRSVHVPRHLQEDAREWILHDPLAEMMAAVLGVDIEPKRRLIRRIMAREARTDAGAGRTGAAEPVSDGGTVPVALP